MSQLMPTSMARFFHRLAMSGLFALVGGSITGIVIDYGSMGERSWSKEILMFTMPFAWVMSLFVIPSTAIYLALDVAYESHEVLALDAHVPAESRSDGLVRNPRPGGALFKELTLSFISAMIFLMSLLPVTGWFLSGVRHTIDGAVVDLIELSVCYYLGSALGALIFLSVGRWTRWLKRRNG